MRRSSFPVIIGSLCAVYFTYYYATDRVEMIQELEVNGGFSNWGDWSACSTTCSYGLRSRKRTCTNPEPSRYGKPCRGSYNESELCPDAIMCPIDGSWSKWTKWTSCKPSCSNGKRTRARLCNNPQPADGGKNCVGNTQEQVECKRNTDCPVDGNWGIWTEWTPCSASCGKGIKKRYRICDMPRPQRGGKICLGEEYSKRKCQLQAC